MTDSNPRGTGKTWGLVLGIIVVALAVWLGVQRGPASDEAAGTIMLAKRHQAESTPAVKAASEADEVATEDLSAEQLAEPDAGHSDSDQAQADQAAQRVNTADGVPFLL